MQWNKINIDYIVKTEKQIYNEGNKVFYCFKLFEYCFKLFKGLVVFYWIFCLFNLYLLSSDELRISVINW